MDKLVGPGMFNNKLKNYDNNEMKEYSTYVFDLDGT